MAEGENVGGINVTVTGDFSDISSAFVAAVQEARSMGADYAAAVEQALDALLTHGSMVSATMVSLASETGAAAEQLSLFGGALEGIPWADASGQLNLFTEEIEPLAAGVASASDAIQEFEDSFSSFGAAAAGAAEQMSLFGDSFGAIPWEDAAGQFALFPDMLEPFVAGLSAASADMLAFNEGVAGTVETIAAFNSGVAASAADLSTFSETALRAAATLAELSPEMAAFNSGVARTDVSIAAFNAGVSRSAASASAARGPIEGLTADMQAFNAGVAGTHSNMQAFNAGVAEAGRELDATAENVAYAGESLGRFGEKASGGFRSVVSEIRLFRAAFYGLMLPELVANMIGSIIKWAETQRNALADSILSWREFNGALAVTDAELKVSNAQLENQLAKIEGQPQDGLKVALLDIAAAGAKMAEELDKDFDAIDEHLKKSSAGWGDFAEALGNLALGSSWRTGGTDFEQMVQSISARLGDLRDKLKAVQVAEGGSSDLGQQMKMLRDQSALVVAEWQKLSALTPTPLITREVNALVALMDRLDARMQALNDQAKNADLKGKVAAARTEPAADKSPKSLPFGDITGGMNDSQVAAAEADATYKEQISLLQQLVNAGARYHEMVAAGMSVLRGAGEDAADWGQRNAEALKAVADGPPVLTAFNDGLKSVDEQVKQGSAEFKDMAGILASLPDPAREAAQEWAAFGKALRDLHLHDTDEQLEQMAHDLDAIRAKGSVADLAEGMRQYDEALAKAAKETGDLEQRLGAGAFDAVPQMFGSIEGAISSDIVKWKGWEQSVISIFQDLAQKALQILLTALFQPLEQMLSSALGGILGALTGGVGDIAGGVIPGLSAFPGLSFSEGTDYVPHTGIHFLHEGEAVITKEENLQRREHKSYRGASPLDALVPHVRRFATGIDYVPHEMLAVLDPGERVMTSEENRSYGAGSFSSVVHGGTTHNWDFRGARGLNENAIMNATIKAARRIGAKWILAIGLLPWHDICRIWHCSI